MEENNEEQKILSGVVMDGVVDSLLTDKGKLTKELEDEKENKKKLIKEIMELKKPKSTKFWVKVYKDTDVSFLSFRDRGILFSLCQLVGKNKGGYLEDKDTDSVLTSWHGRYKGKPLGYTCFREMLGRLAVRCGLPKESKTHVLRKTCGTNLIEKHDLSDACAWLGHTKADTTWKYYRVDYKEGQKEVEGKTSNT